MVPETQNTPYITSCTIPETQKLPELTSAMFQETQETPGMSLEVPHTPKRPVKPTERDTTHNFTSFQNIFMKELEAVERKFEQLKETIISLSELTVSNCNEISSLTVEISKNPLSPLEKLKFSAEIKFKKHESSLTKIRFISYQTIGF